MGETRQAIDMSVEAWYSHDRDGWVQLGSEDVDLVGPGFGGTGSAAWGQAYDLWQDGFPDNQIQPQLIAVDGEVGTVEAVFTGTHSGVLKPPTGPEIPPTQKQVRLNYVAISRVVGGKFASLHIYFDQVDLLTQLGLMPAPAGTG